MWPLATDLSLAIIQESILYVHAKRASYIYFSVSHSFLVSTYFMHKWVGIIREIEQESQNDRQRWTIWRQLELLVNNPDVRIKGKSDETQCGLERERKMKRDYREKEPGERRNLERETSLNQNEINFSHTVWVILNVKLL